MAAPLRRFALHVNVPNQLAHLVSITLGAGVASHEVAGLAFGPIRMPLPEFLSHALELSYGDADGVLMALDMRGLDEGWYELDAAGFAALAALPIPGEAGRPFAGHRVDGDRMLASVAPGVELDLTGMLALPLL